MPHSFLNKEELVEELASNKHKIELWFSERQDSLDKIVHQSVGSNTFRAFRKLSQKPSVVFRNWALGECEAAGFRDQLNRIDSQSTFDGWIKGLSDRLNAAWQASMSESIPYGPRRKLPNLLLKEVVRWTALDEAHRARLVNWLHVPLDSYTLSTIRNCILDPAIPKNATMKFVVGATMYDQIQAVIRALAVEARVPAIYFDNLAWNAAHQASSPRPLSLGAITD
ncbi:MAG TPA: hypothetical protein VGJ16_12150 [Pirellulales bacterium]|jgi:hypothetical protein